MAKCKYCGKNGLFVFVNQDGLCKNCQLIIVGDVNQRFRIINDSMKLIEESKNLKTRLGRCDTLIEHARELTRYENLGINTITPSPSDLVSAYLARKDEIIVDNIEQYLIMAETKVEIADTSRKKINEYNKVLLEIEDVKTELTDKERLNKLQLEIKTKVHKIQFDSYLDAAKKAEFKGQKKKAIDQFQEALYFIKTDNVDDSLQKEWIDKLEKKISELSGS